MSSPISYLLPALLLLFFFFNFRGSNANFSSSKNCPIYNCKNGPEFHYPFWKIEDSAAADQYCGYHGFGLKCSSESGKPILTLPNSDSFYVKDINFPEYTMTLVDIGVVDQSCPSARHSISVGTLPFDYSPSDANLSFYFNCTASNPDDPYPVPPIPCLESPDSYGGITNQSFVFMEGEDTKEFDWSEKCAEKVVVTVMKKSIPDIITGRFVDGFKNGFVLNWSNATECGSCEHGGGHCGYNTRVTTTKPALLCFCQDDCSCPDSYTKRNGLCQKGMLL